MCCVFLFNLNGMISSKFMIYRQIFLSNSNTKTQIFLALLIFATDLYKYRSNSKEYNAILIEPNQDIY